MSTVVPKRRIYDGEVVSPEDFNATVDNLNREIVNLNEHNLTSAFNKTLPHMDNAVAWRLKHDYNGSSTIANSVVAGTPESALGVLIVTETDQWVPIWEFSWTSSEFSNIYAMANVQANTMTAAAGGFTGTNDPPEFLHRDAHNIKLAWILDGVNPSEHVRGALDTGASGLNMEEGFSGFFNAQDVSALFPLISPGDHTIQLCIMRTGFSDGVNHFKKRINVPMWSALVWEIRR